ncbi:hypothetical protein [Calothrix sp. PCC 7507]|uniref:hypothetical protein n=1 Tax=Calothrix sp. PCC 7507 TaxID=99598 RepID=UPI00030D7881|nr:hypothetical protein [Calothrix sp. PCC 7507]
MLKSVGVGFPHPFSLKQVTGYWQRFSHQKKAVRQQSVTAGDPLAVPPGEEKRYTGLPMLLRR